MRKSPTDFAPAAAPSHHFCDHQNPFVLPLLHHYRHLLSVERGCAAQGAAEIVLRRCVSVMGPTGESVPLSDEMRALLEDTVTTMASTGLRTLCLTKRDVDEAAANGQPDDFWDNPPDDALTLCCIVGIKVGHLPSSTAVCLMCANKCAHKRRRYAEEIASAEAHVCCVVQLVFHHAPCMRYCWSHGLYVLPSLSCGGCFALHVVQQALSK